MEADILFEKIADVLSTKWEKSYSTSLWMGGGEAVFCNLAGDYRKQSGGGWELKMAPPFTFHLVNF